MYINNNFVISHGDLCYYREEQSSVEHREEIVRSWYLMWVWENVWDSDRWGRSHQVARWPLCKVSSIWGLGEDQSCEVGCYVSRGDHDSSRGRGFHRAEFQERPHSSWEVAESFKATDRSKLSQRPSGISSQKCAATVGGGVVVVVWVFAAASKRTRQVLLAKETVLQLDLIVFSTK